MAIIRSSEIREMDVPEMDEQITQLRKDLMKMRGVLASGGIPEGVGKTREIKRTIARILTEKKKRSAEVKTSKKVKSKEVTAKK
ncbi:MAG: 50S ribosomal protein L29 [Candidatus Altiarchaeota archaeon]